MSQFSGTVVYLQGPVGWSLATIFVAILLLACYDLFCALQMYFRILLRHSELERLGEKPDPIRPTKLSLRHAVMFLPQKWNYWAQAVLGAWYVYT